MFKIKHIVFDLGNVLYDISVESVYNQLISTSKNNLPFQKNVEYLNKAHLLFMGGQPDESGFLMNIKEFLQSPLSVNEIRSIWLEIIVGFRIEFEPILRNLKEKFTLSILSNTDLIHYKKVREQVPWFESIFHHIFLSYKLNVIKPDIVIFEKVITTLNTEPDTILLFDDIEDNIKAAKQAGIQAHCANNSGHVLTIMKEYHIL